MKNKTAPKIQPFPIIFSPINFIEEPTLHLQTNTFAAIAIPNNTSDRNRFLSIINQAPNNAHKFCIHHTERRQYQLQVSD